jgi:hypothetical protein
MRATAGNRTPVTQRVIKDTEANRQSVEVTGWRTIPSKASQETEFCEQNSNLQTQWSIHPRPRKFACQYIYSICYTCYH